MLAWATSIFEYLKLPAMQSLTTSLSVHEVPAQAQKRGVYYTGVAPPALEHALFNGGGDSTETD